MKAEVLIDLELITMKDFTLAYKHGYFYAILQDWQVRIISLYTLGISIIVSVLIKEPLSHFNQFC